MVRNTDGHLVPISTLTKGKVALIDLWASWCGPCRSHSIAMIPVYEKYKDKGFTVIAIARERNRQAMENAAKKDGYPWQSLLELNDENGVWRKNGAGNAGGAMYLIDRDGTILSTSTDAEELEPIIKKALNIDFIEIYLWGLNNFAIFAAINKGLYGRKTVQKKDLHSIAELETGIGR